MFALLNIPVLIIAFLLTIILLAKRYFIVGGCVAVVGLLYNVYTNSFALSFANDKAMTAKVLRIMSYNVNAKYGKYENLHDWRNVILFIDSINPDIIFPQEYSFYGGDSLRNALDVRYPYNSKLFFGNGYYMTDMVFSRFPVVKLDYLLGFGKTIYVMDISVDGKVVKAVNCHLHSNNFTSEVESGEHKFLQKLKEGYDERAKEVDDIVDSLKSCTNAPLIVCGDMNDVSGSYTIRTLRDSLKLKDAWWQGGTGFGFTYHGYGVMRFRLDHILYNKYLELQSVSVPHVGYSDHWPVVADLVVL